MRRFTLLGVAALFLAGCQDAVAPTDPGRFGAETRLSAAQQDAEASFGDRYIVVFDRGVRDVPSLARSLTERAGGELRFVYEHALRGFAARLPEAAIEGIRRNPDVAYVEQDGPMHAIGSGTQSPVASWGLDRIDQSDPPLDDAYTYNASGAGVTAYILDTGIRFSHNDFGGRASFGFDAIGDGQNGEDCSGHGTHVAGTVGGSAYGVAKDVGLVAVRVLDCNGSGSYSGVIAGIDWVTANAQKPAVANMSLGGGSSSSVDDAVNNSVNSGVFYAVAAGNGHWLFGTPEDACTKSPAGAAQAFTVGATDANDSEASFSNYGTCVDMLAPGVSITSAWIGSDTDANTISGTSMAAPHVAGAAAAYLASNTGASPAQVADALSTNASPGKINLHSSSSSGGTPNLLLYTAFITGDGNSAPTASLADPSCTDLSCSFDGSGSSDSDGTIAGYAWDFGDGSTGTGATPSHTYGSGGTYTVTLTVTDDDGATGTASADLTVEDPPNSPPNAEYVYTCSGLSCAFDGGYSTDSDGTIVSYTWDYGDGTGESGSLVSTTYKASGTYTVLLTVTDDDGATGTVSADVTVSDGSDSAPSASFTSTCTDLACEFTDTSTDDGTISSWSWDFGDGATSTVQNPSHTYGAGGTYTVTLTVTDDGGQTGTSTQDVTVSEPVTGISLSANGYKERGRHKIDLSWSGTSTTSTEVDVYRDGSVLTTIPDDGAYTDSTSNRGQGSYTYQVCEAGTTTCSNEVTVTF